ncbi:MAG: glycosyltransferase family 2 protein [Muribaculaceae bacterium]|nr:glycosyltransferase family 2 protein [Muribaculaceae bacterium]
MKQLAVIILNWNGVELLRRFIPSAVKYTSGEEVDLIVADNGSTDESVSWLRENYPELKVMELGENYGFAAGYNHVIADTNYPYTILLNSDVEVTEGWWQPLLRFMREHPEAGAIQPKIRSYHAKDMFEYAGAAGGLLDKLGYPYCRGRIFDTVQRDEGQYDGEAVEVAWASGAAMMVRTEVYLRLGGLDADFFAHMEEIDLCCRMRGAGYKIYVVPDSHIFHVGGASLPKENPRKTYLNFRNNLLLLHKNLPKSKGRRILFIRRLADTLAFLKFLVSGDIANSKAIYNAHKDFKKMRRKYTQYPEHDYMKEIPGGDRSIVLDYYLLGKRL